MFIPTLICRFDLAAWSWLIPWVVGLSIVTFFGSIVGVWWMLIQLPVDYLDENRVEVVPATNRAWIPFLAKRLLSNLVGMAFLAAGVVMLVTPGQGLLAILVGLTLVDFPAKQQLLHRLIAHPKVWGAINRIRKRSDRPPLLPKSSFVSSSDS